MNFKVGDRVRFIRDSGNDLTLEISKGTEGIVTAIADDYITIENFNQIAIGWDGESYTGEVYFTDFEALEIIGEY